MGFRRLLVDNVLRPAWRDLGRIHVIFIGLIYITLNYMLSGITLILNKIPRDGSINLPLLGVRS